MITSEHRPPFDACITCVNQARCPVLSTGAKGNISVPKPYECILKQLPPQEIAKLAKQLDSNIGLNKLQYEQLGRQLEFTLDFMKDLENKVIRG